MPEAPRSAGLFAFSDWDAAPALAGVLHFAYPIWMAAIFPTTSFGVMVLLGAIYAVSISWNINGISHNFLHNPFFVDERLNRAFSLILSLTMFFSQAFYEDVPISATATAGMGRVRRWTLCRSMAPRPRIDLRTSGVTPSCRSFATMWA